jgi:1,4-alpha-glucan branching enzyme
MARQNAKRKVTFTIAAPEAHEVALAGDFTNWDQAPVTMKKHRGGVWSATLALQPGSYQYRLLVDGQWQDDPACATHIPNAFGSQNCLRQVA